MLDSLPDKLKKQENLTITHTVVAEIEPEEIEEAAKPNGQDSVPEDASGKNMTAAEIRKRMDELLLEQNNLDFALDLAELRNLMRDALENSTDEELMDVLQIKREEVRDVLKEMQHALEEVKASENTDNGRVHARQAATPSSSSNPLTLSVQTGLHSAGTDADQQARTTRNSDNTNTRQPGKKTQTSALLSNLDEEPTMGISRASTLPMKLYEQNINDELDRIFLEASIKALRRTRTN